MRSGGCDVVGGAWEEEKRGMAGRAGLGQGTEGSFFSRKLQLKPQLLSKCPFMAKAREATVIEHEHLRSPTKYGIRPHSLCDN